MPSGESFGDLYPLLHELSYILVLVTELYVEGVDVEIVSHFEPVTKKISAAFDAVVPSSFSKVIRK